MDKQQEQIQIRQRHKPYFAGKYYKHQANGKTVCLIEGVARGEKFLQIITNSKTYWFDDYTDCTFSASGVKLNLPNIQGEVAYSQLTPLATDIMGYFRHLPMQCRHHIYSMHHSLRGGFEIDGEFVDFNNGIGYIEGDSGRSFPKRYIWAHANDFSNEKCSIMVAIADIPVLCFGFMGCICAIIYNDVEYRIATYKGAKVKILSAERIEIAQGKLRLELDIEPRDFLPLKMPINGKMVATTHESNTTIAKFKLYEHDKLIFELTSNNTSYECIL